MTYRGSDVCYVGPLGSMVALPDVEADVAVTLNRSGTLTRALRGGVTNDVYGRKRSWTWPYDSLLEEQVAYLDALVYGMVPGPLRMIDARRANRLPEDFASGGSVTASNVAFGTDASSASYYHPMSDTGTGIESLGPGRMLRGYQEWQVVVASADNYVRPADPRYADNQWRCPLLPGEQVAASVWVTGPASVGVRLYINFADRSGFRLSVPVTDYVQLNPVAWTKISGVTVTPAGYVAAYPILGSATGHVASGTSILHTAWMLGPPGGAPEPAGIDRLCTIPDIGVGWRIGGGGPFVVPDGGDAVYQAAGFYGQTLTLHES